MPLYRVTWDDQDILDYTDERMVLLSPHLEMEINLAGSLRFVVPPYHTYYDLFTDQTMLISTVRVYEDEELIWFGRPLEMRTDFFKQKEIYCEGGLSYFNDSIHEHNKYDNVSLHDFFRKVVANHNYQVDSPRQFLVGNITVDDKVVYREPRYEKTIDVLRDQCLDTTDGYFFVRQENGKNYIDWLKDMPFSCNQVIEFAENMLDVSTSFDGNDYATCVMPLGANDDNGDPINVYDVNNNDLLVISDMAKLYGRIVTVIQFSDIEDKYELLEEGRKALDRIQYNSRIIECSAADLHSKDGSKEIFKLGQLVHCYSEPHDLEIDLPLSKIELNLDTAAKNITLGIIKKKTLTRISRPKETEPYQQEPYTPEPYYPSPDPDWEIIMPDENGDPVTAIRMPIKITIARDPNKTEYEPGEALDFTGMIVNIWTKDKDGKEVIWTNPPKYTDGTAPMSELSFSTKTAPNIEEFSVQVIWKYNGRSYSALLSLRTSQEETDEWEAEGLYSPIYLTPIKVGDILAAWYDPKWTVVSVEGNPLALKVYTDANRDYVNCCVISKESFKVTSSWPTGTFTSRQITVNGHGFYYVNRGSYSVKDSDSTPDWAISEWQRNIPLESIAEILLFSGHKKGQ